MSTQELSQLAAAATPLATTDKTLIVRGSNNRLGELSDLITLLQAEAYKPSTITASDNGDGTFDMTFDYGAAGSVTLTTPNLKGDTGATGAAGSDGSDGADGNRWYTGTGAPLTATGSNGDYYIDESTGDVYGKAGGSWSSQGWSLKGDTGAAGAAGSDGADGTDGTDGVSVTGVSSTDNGDGTIDIEFTFSNGTTQTIVTPDLTGPAGAAGADGADGTDGEVTNDGIATLTNKTMDADNNTFSNMGYAEMDADIQGMTDAFEGMAFDKPDLYVVDDTGLQFEVEKTGGGGDLDFWINNQRATLDCTTGSGTGGRARVALTAGSDANTPATNYIYVTASGGTATLAASTSLPTGAFTWIGKCIVPDATTWATTGEFAIQRYTESMENSSRGLFSHEREKLRALGAVYISGLTQTLNITVNGATPDNVHLDVATGSVYQIHRQTFPNIATGPYYYGNGQNAYEQLTDLNAALNLQDGTAITNNQRFNLVVWGAVNYSSGDCKLFVNLPDSVYAADASAAADTNNSADLSVPDDMRSVAFLVARIALKYTSASGGTWTEIGTYSLLGTPVGARSGGATAVASNEFLDTQFRIQDDGDTTKQIAFQASGITTGNTRTITMVDSDLTLGAYAPTLLNVANEAAFKAAVNLEIGTDVLAQQTIGIADNNLLEVDAAAGAPNSAEYARFTANGLEGRTEAEFKADFNLEIGTDVLAQQTIGIADNNLLEVDAAAGAPNSAEYARFTANGLEGRTEAEFKADFNLEIGTDVQAYDAELAALAGLTSAANKIIRFTGSGTAEVIDYTKCVQIEVFGPTTAVATGDGAKYFRIPASLNGYNITAVGAQVVTVSSSGTPTIQIHNVTDATDVLSTLLTIDANEKDSSTAATAAVINTANDDVNTGEQLRIDVDVAGTSTAGLVVTIEFEKP